MSSKTIKNTAEISLEELRELKQSGTTSITISDPETQVRSHTYSIDDLIVVKEKINTYISQIPDIPNDDPDREKKIFTYLYIRLAEDIQYDEVASRAAGSTGYYRDMSEDYVSAANSLIGRFY